MSEETTESVTDSAVGADTGAEDQSTTIDKATTDTDATQDAKTDDTAKAGDETSETDDKSDDGKKDSDDGKKEDDTKAAGDEWALAAPEGMEGFQEDFDKFATDMSGWLKENPDATPQQALAEAANRQASLVAEQTAEQERAFEKQVSDWEAEAKKDKDIGGEKFEENVAAAVQGLNAVDESGEIKKYLDTSGLGSNPAFIKAFMKVGALVANAEVLGDDKPSSSGANHNNSRYPSSQKA